ncbi:MAG: hypothetical protein Q9173_003260 [Seirophora scorigena]
MTYSYLTAAALHSSTKTATTSPPLHLFQSPASLDAHISHHAIVTILGMATTISGLNSVVSTWLCDVDADSLPSAEILPPNACKNQPSDLLLADSNNLDYDTFQARQLEQCNGSALKETWKRRRSSRASDDSEPLPSPSKRARLTMEALQSSNLGAPMAPNNLPTPDESTITWNNLASNAEIDVQIRSNDKVIGDLLTSYGLKLQDPAIHKYPRFRQSFLDILITTRKTPMKDAIAQGIEEAYDYYNRGTEKTFMSKVFLPTIGNGRHPMPRHFSDARTTITPSRSRSSSASTTAERLQYEVLRHVEFFADGIASTENADFVRGIMLTGMPGDAKENSLVKAMAKAPGWTNPRPDYVYGYRKDWPGLETPTDASQNLSSNFEVAPDTKLPFFIVEARGDGGCLAGAEDQARRAGATCVRAHRYLIDMSENLKVVPPAGPDSETAIFTCTASPASVVIWLNWVEYGDEVDDNGNRVGTYHMNKLKSYLWDDRDSLRALRAALHSIMDWAVYARLPKARALHTQVYETMRTRGSTARPKRKATATPNSSPQKSSTPSVASKKSRAGTAPQVNAGTSLLSSTQQPLLSTPKKPIQPST